MKVIGLITKSKQELRRWAVPWDIVGLAETWLDAESEKGVALRGFGLLCASRRVRTGGVLALFIRDGLRYRERLGHI